MQQTTTDSTPAPAHVAPELAGAGAGAGAAADVVRPHPPDTRLHGRQLLVARAVWAASAAVLVGLYVFLLSACLAQLQTVCSGVSCSLVQPTPASAHALQLLGFSVDSYAALSVALILLSSLFAFAISGVIVWRKSDDWIALLVALAQVAIGTELVPYLLQTSRSAWQVLALVMNALDFAVLFLAFALFPTGRFVPSWVRWFVVGWVAASAVLIVSYVLTGDLRYTAITLVWLTVYTGVTGAQVYRYRFVSRPRERAQTRWVLFGGVTALVIVLADFTPTFLFPALGGAGSLYRLASVSVYTLPIILFSVCLGVGPARSALRHRCDPPSHTDLRCGDGDIGRGLFRECRVAASRLSRAHRAGVGGGDRGLHAGDCRTLPAGAQPRPGHG